MPRANRYHLSGLALHITHRCHNRAYLLKFLRDREQHRHWLYEARRRFGLSLLNFNITSNHVHLLVYDNGAPGVIESSLQLSQGRIAQEYNGRKGRDGAFWQDRYHATAVESGRHLRSCFTHINLNMVRAGRVSHPEDWQPCGYHEIQRPRERYALLDLCQAPHLMGFNDIRELAGWQSDAITIGLENPLQREPAWTESLAVGRPEFLEQVAARLGIVARFREIYEHEAFPCLQEPLVPYNPILSEKSAFKGGIQPLVRRI
jgi:putative transposase